VEMVRHTRFSQFGFIRTGSDRLFFIEGALTILVALVAVFVLPDFPSNSHRWLSPIEVRLAVKRMEEDAGTGDEGQTEAKGQGQVLIDTLTDRKVMYMALKCVIISSYGALLAHLLHEVSFAWSSPFPSTRSSPRSLPRLDITELLPFFSAHHLGCLQLWSRLLSQGGAFICFGKRCKFMRDYRHSDATGERSFHMIVPLCVGLVGFVIASCTMNTAARYFSL
jgi:hypothetical protein